MLSVFGVAAAFWRDKKPGQAWTGEGSIRGVLEKREAIKQFKHQLPAVNQQNGLVIVSPLRVVPPPAHETRARELAH